MTDPSANYSTQYTFPIAYFAHILAGQQWSDQYHISFRPSWPGYRKVKDAHGYYCNYVSQSLQEADCPGRQADGWPTLGRP